MNHAPMNLYYNVLPYLRLEDISNLYYLDKNTWNKIVPILLPYIKRIYQYKLENNTIGLVRLHRLYSNNSLNKFILRSFRSLIEKNYEEEQWMALLKCYEVDYSFLKLAYDKLYNIDNKSELFNWCNMSIPNNIYRNDLLYKKIKKKQTWTKYYMKKHNMKKFKILNNW